MAQLPGNPFILLFKSPKDDDEASDPYVKALQQTGYKAICQPVLSFTFSHQEELLSDLTRVDHFSGIIFTSQRAAQAVAACISSNEDVAKSWQGKRAYVVGMATGIAVKKLGFATLGEECGNAQALAEHIISECGSEKGHFLFPCGNLAKETLPKLLTDSGIKVTSITVYETVPDPYLKATLHQLFKSKGFPSCVVYFSPSGVQFTQSVLQDLAVPSDTWKVISIGPSTDQALIKLGLPLAGTAAKPTPEAVVQTIQQVSGSPQ